MRTRFNMLRVLQFSHKVGTSYYYICECDCGRLKVVQAANLYSDRTKSCGCKQHYPNTFKRKRKKRGQAATVENEQAA